nr:MAG TPA: hypothetical protein [Bacteriophage sp.]
MYIDLSNCMFETRQNHVVPVKGRILGIHWNMSAS